MKDTGRQPRRGWPALRDLLLISLAVAGVLWFGAATDAFQGAQDWLLERFHATAGELVVAPTLVAVGLALFSLLQWRSARYEAAARRRAEIRFRTLVENMPAVIYTWDPREPAGTTPPPYVSPQVEPILGFSVERWKAEPALWIEQIHPEDRARVVEASDHADRTGDPLCIEYRHVKPDGSVIWIREEAIVVEHDASGRPSLVQGLMVDVTERRRAEQQVAQAEARYRTLVERVPAVTYTWDATYKSGEAPAPYISPQVRSLLGYGQDEFGDPSLWTRLIHPDDLEAVMAEWEECERTSSAFRAEYRMSTREGRTIWVRDEALPIGCDERGHPLFQGVVFDITERKAADDKVREAEERYRSLVEHMPVVTYVDDRRNDPEQRYISPGIERILGYSQAEWLEDEGIWHRVVHPDDRERAREEIEASQARGVPWSLEYRMVAKDGRIVWIHDDARIVKPGSTFDRSVWQGVCVDVTARKEAELLLREAEETYRTLVEQLPVVVYQDAVDDTSTAIYISPQYQQMFGYPPEARTADPRFWIDHLHPDDRERILEESRRTNETGDPFSVEYRFMGRDGQIVWVRDEAVLLRHEDGSPSRWQGVLIDVTQAKTAEEMLSRRDAVLEAAGFAAERLLKAHEWEPVVPEVLERLGRASASGRVSLFENVMLEGAEVAMRLRRQWVAGGVPPLLEGGAGSPYAKGHVRWQAALSSGRTIHGWTRNFPAAERVGPMHEGVHSRVLVPVFVGDEWWGFLAFDDFETERDWPAPEIEALKTAADTLGAAIGRARAEALRTEAELRYRKLVETIPAVTYIQALGPDAPLTYMSPQLERLTGYSVDEWGASDYGRWLDTIHPDDRALAVEADDRAERSGQPFVVEYRQRHKDGRWIWVHDEAALVRDDTGSPLYWQGIRFDITAQKTAEHHLREAEERYRSLVESMPAVTYVDAADDRYTTLYVSPQIEALFGYSPQEWTSDPDLWIDGIHPDDRERVLAAADRHNRDGELLALEYRFRAKDARWVWVTDHATVVRDADGIILFSQGVMLDITERRQAEEQLRETEARYRAIVEHVPAAIYVDRPDGSMKTVYVSPQIREIMGVSPQRYLDEPGLWLDLMTPEFREEMRRSYLEALTSGRSWQGEYRIVTPDGREGWVHDETAFVLDEDGTPLFLQGVMFDITERKLAEQALRDSEQREREAAEGLRALDEMKNTFLAAVSHELRSPLTSILGLSLTLEQQRLSTEDRRDLTRRVAQNARKLDRLLKDLLDIDRLSRGNVTPQLRPTDVGALVRGAVDSLELGDRPVSVEAEPVVIPVDGPKVERIVENLVMNAVRHTGPDVTICVRVWAGAGGAFLAVEDDGPGVPEDIQSAIFEPFRQGPTAAPHAPGTGIGLSLVAMFTELHGGRAWVEEREGGGASFRVFLPGQTAEEADGHGHRTAPRGGRRVDAMRSG